MCPYWTTWCDQWMRNETVSTIIIFYIQNLMTRRFVLTSSDGSKLLDFCSTRAQHRLNPGSNVSLNFGLTHHYKDKYYQSMGGPVSFQVFLPLFCFLGREIHKVFIHGFLNGFTYLILFFFESPRIKLERG